MIPELFIGFKFTANRVEVAVLNCNLPLGMVSNQVLVFCEASLGCD
jgi:hypothetical protein